MNDFTIDEIKNNTLCEKAKQHCWQINKDIKGRICMTNYLHYLFVIKEMMGESCKTYLEIGIMHGGSFCVMLQSDYESKFIGVCMFDYYGSEKDPGSRVPVSFENTQTNVKRMNKNDYPITLIKGDSHLPAMVSAVREKTENGVDLFLIDGDHSKEGVISDFENYSPMISKNGIIVFDNYNDSGWKSVTEGIKSLDFEGWDEVGILGKFFIVKKK